jgi:hypothetical protein
MDLRVQLIQDYNEGESALMQTRRFWNRDFRERSAPRLGKKNP